MILFPEIFRHFFMQTEEVLKSLHHSLQIAKNSIESAEKWAEQLADKNHVQLSPLHEKAEKCEMVDFSVAEEKQVEGIFDGKNMIAKNKNVYPVPANYASKSKLVPGDKLKLSVQSNGAFIFKQIELVPRKLITGRLILEGSQYKVLADGGAFKVLYASVTFFRGNVGDHLTIIVPEKDASEWAAIENILPSDQKVEV